MSTSSLFQAVRAIAIEFARRIYVPVLITFIIVTVIAGLALWWLVSMSAWWWLLAVPLIIIGVLGLGILSILGVLFRVLRRSSSKPQRHAVSEFVDSLQEISEVVQTPKIYLLFMLVKDIVRPGNKSYLKTVVDNGKTMRSRFASLVALF